MHTFKIGYPGGTGAISYGSPVRITFSWEKTLWRHDLNKQMSKQTDKQLINKKDKTLG